MNHAVHNKLIAFIWSIADDCLRDVYVRGKYRDVILLMFVLRRLDALLEPSKPKVLEEINKGFDDDLSLRNASGYVFYNISKWTLQSLYNTATNNSQILLANFETYLNGFSANVKEIINRFKLLEQICHMVSKEVLLDVVEKFVSPYINLTPDEKSVPDGNILPALSNLGMGYIFEEFIRKYNEEDNEEAGEHFTPREVIELMTHLVFDPIKEQLPAVLTIYEPACSSGGMLTESEKFIKEKYPQTNCSFYLYGKEINDETYAICKSDMIKGNDPANIRVGSTLTSDEFAGTHFNFMLTNPPYGKSWSTDEKYIKNGKDIIDSRFEVSLLDYWGKTEIVPAIPRTSDGQLLFLMEMLSKMKQPSSNTQGSRIASVHNGSALFTGDAGGGESNIRRYIIENDWLEAIIQLPNNLFYNTDITTYIWVLSNNKALHRQGKVQLIDANLLYRKLRKNLGDKNCEFSPENITEITQTYLDFIAIDRQTDSEHNPIGIASQIFDNQDFGCYKDTIERPDRRRAQFSEAAIVSLRFDKKLGDIMQVIYDEHGEQVYEQGYLKAREKALFAELEKQGFSFTAKDKANLSEPEFWQKSQTLHQHSQRLMAAVGTAVSKDFNDFKKQVDTACKTLGLKLSASEKNAILFAVSEYDETAAKVIKKKEKFTDSELERLLTHLGCEAKDLPDFGYYPSGKDSEYLTFESSSELRDSESVPLKDSIHRYFLAEVKPHIDEAWINLDSVKIGYEISFNKYFYQHKPLRNLEEVASDILALEAKADGLIAKILGK